MKAVVCDRYGPPDVLRVEEVERLAPRDDELLVRVRACTVNRLDCHTREANRSNGLVISGLRFGAQAEFTCIPQTARVAPMPEGVGFEEAAAATDGALNALWCLRLAGPLQGRRVLIYGASGAIGTAAVQVAKHFGAEVTAVCGPKGVDVVKAIGADRVIDYTKQDFTSDRGRYFSVFDAVGKESFAHCRDVIEPGGTYLATDGLRNLLLALWTSRVGDRKVMFKLPPRYTQQDVVLIKELMEAGSYRPVIDRVYPVEDVVEAARYVETQQKIGNVVLAISDGRG